MKHSCVGSSSPLPTDLNLQHVAIIMDGNGRWAEQRNLPRSEGHREGAQALRRTLRAVRQWNIPYLTVFAFSTENWQRPELEVGQIFSLMVEFARSEQNELAQQGIRVIPIGDLEALPRITRAAVEGLEHHTRAGTKLTLFLAVNYGGRHELVRAARRIAELVQAGKIQPESIDANVLSQFMYTHPAPDPDLVLRTGGEFRLSNFLLFQSAYADFISTPVLWPDFAEADLAEALHQYAARVRRFGRVIAETETENE